MGQCEKRKKELKIAQQKLKHEQFNFVVDFVFEETQNNNGIHKMKDIAKI